MQLSIPHVVALPRLVHIGILLVTVSGLTAGPSDTTPGDALGWATCGGAARPWCDVGAGTTPGGPTTASTPSTGPQPAQQVTCHDRHGVTVPCYTPDLGALGSDGCYYKPSSPSPDLQAALGGAGTGPGGWYDFTCPGMPGTSGGTRWVPGVAPAAAGPDPAALARQAVSRLGLPRLAIAMSPAGAQLVRVPTWLWINPAAWRPQSATAQVPGVAVTATATPSSVVWATGDGGSVTCTGPGTPWQAGSDPAAASPTCGHTYLQASSGMPDGRFPVTATVSWSIRWAGAGQGGALPALTTTTATTVQVNEVGAVVVGR